MLSLAMCRAAQRNTFNLNSRSAFKKKIDKTNKKSGWYYPFMSGNNKIEYSFEISE